MSAVTSTAGAASRPWVGEFVVLAALWGSSFLFMRLGAAEFGAVPTAALRVGIAAAFLLPILLWQGQWAAFRRNAGPILLVGLLNSGIPFALYSYAVLSITTGLTSILNATVPLFGAIVAWLWLQDRPHASRALGLAVGFGGVTLLAWDKAGFKPGGSGGAESWAPSLAIGACLLATLCYGISASFTKRYLSGVPPLATATGSQIGATLGLAGPAFWLWPVRMPGPTAWGAIVAVAILCTGIAYILFFRLIEHAGPARALAVTFVVPVFAVVYGIAFLGESLTGWMVACGLVIACGTALATGLLKLKP